MAFAANFAFNESTSGGEKIRKGAFLVHHTSSKLDKYGYVPVYENVIFLPEPINLPLGIMSHDMIFEIS